MKDRKKIISLALATALGFWTGLVITNYVQRSLNIEGPLVFNLLVIQPLQGIIGGAVLGGVLGYLEKMSVTQR